MSTNVTIPAIVSLYLYGTETPSDDIASRLRPDDTGNLGLSINVESFMSNVGRFSSPLQTDIVSNFLNGSLDLLSTVSPDENGVRSITFNQLIEAKIFDEKDGRVAISQYTTGTNSPDWAERAFIWGSTAFVLSRDTIFIDNGTRREVHGGAMLPYDDNFDLTAGGVAAQIYNDVRISGALDPYGIGHKLDFIFENSGKAAYAASHASDVYTAADLTEFSNVDFATKVLEYSNLDLLSANLIIGDSSVMSGIETGSNYINNGHNVVFGNSQANFLDSSSLAGAFADHSLPNIYIGGDGDDTISTSSTMDGEVAYGGEGNDLIQLYGNLTSTYGDVGNDDIKIFGDEAFVLGDAGEDEIAIFGYFANVNAGEGNDLIKITGTESTIVTAAGADRVSFDTLTSHGGRDTWGDADGDDVLLSGQEQLFGGDKTLLSIIDYSYRSYHYYERNYGAADINAYYEKSSSGATIFSASGNSLFIENYESGVAQLNIQDYAFERTTSPGDTNGATFYDDLSGVSHYGGFGNVPIYEVGIEL